MALSKNNLDHFTGFADSWRTGSRLTVRDGDTRYMLAITTVKPAEKDTVLIGGIIDRSGPADSEDLLKEDGGLFKSQHPLLTDPETEPVLKIERIRI